MTAVAKDVQGITSALRTALAKRLGKHRFELWFGNESIIEIANGIVRISLPNLLFQRWVANQFREEIAAACKEVLGFCPTIEFLQCESPSNEGSSPAVSIGNPENVQSGEHSGGLSSATNGQKRSCPTDDETREALPVLFGSCSTSGGSSFSESALSPIRPEASSEQTGESNSSCRLQELEHHSQRLPAAWHYHEKVYGNTEYDQPTSLEGERSSAGNPEEAPKEQDTLFPVLVEEQAELSRQRKTGRSFRGKKRSSSPESLPGSLAGPQTRNGRTLLRFSDFAVGPCNQLAYTAAYTAATQPGHVSPLFLFGPTSVGKTHLLQAICAATRQHHPGLIAIYVWAEEFTTGFLEALRGGGLPSFRHKFRHVDLLAIDDVQFLLGKHCTQRELLYTIDTLLREGKQVVLASDRRPEALVEFGEDFVARLRSGMVCEIQWPDEEIRLPLVQQLCRRVGLELDREIQEYVATHVHGHAREFLGALRRIHALAHFRGKPITLELVQEALSDFVGSCARPIRLKDVANVICHTFQLQPEELAGPSRAQHVAHPRLLAMWLARKYTRAGLNEISRFFGRRSHSVVLSAQQKVERWLAEGKSLSAGGTTIPVQQVIKELERRLKAS